MQKQIISISKDVLRTDYLPLRGNTYWKPPNIDELAAVGVRIVIYANQMIRSAYPAMLKTAESILKNQRALEADRNCIPIKEIVTLIPQSC